MPYALNKGLELCSFNYVARMDSDDIMKMDRNSKNNTIFMINNKDCVVLGGQCEIMNESSKKIIYITKHKEVIDKNYLKQEVRNNKLWFMNHPTIMYKKDIINKCGNYNTDLIGHSEDTYLWINVLKKWLFIT